jgi:predicted dehydrogenase
MKLLILGTGSMAQAHATNFASIAGVELVAAVETNPERLVTFSDEHRIANRFADLDDAIAWGGFDAAANVTRRTIRTTATASIGSSMTR